MNELTNLIFTEKYRPRKLEDLVFTRKAKIQDYLKQPNALPSFLFVSKSPGTGKTSLAIIIKNTLKCDYLKLNASDERGIDVIREKIKVFVRGMSSDAGKKRMVFLDEADGLTGIAQNSLRNMMEEYSKNAFFILTCNNISKIIEAIQSRCIEFHFDKPDKKEIYTYLIQICNEEEVRHIEASVKELVDLYYPNIRNMVKILQDTKVSDEPLEIFLDTIQNFDELWEDIRNKKITAVKDKVLKAEIDPVAFNNWLFRKIFDEQEKFWAEFGHQKIIMVIAILAENEVYFAQNMNQDIIFLANALKIMEII